MQDLLNNLDNPPSKSELLNIQINKLLAEAKALENTDWLKSGALVAKAMTLDKEYTELKQKEMQ